ncbi:MAG TPA: hypothetical protein VN696_17510 [Pyrinomonadaceae bacterium]|nr:hypothetical protein [Pyrinomonadaceae bacterium]
MAIGTKTSAAVADSSAKVSEKTGGAYTDMAAVIQSELNRIIGNAGPNAGLVQTEPEDVLGKGNRLPDSNGTLREAEQK